MGRNFERAEFNDSKRSHAMSTIDHEKPSEQAEQSLLLGREDAARLCGVSVTSWDRLKAGALNPQPIKLGGRVLWKRSDLEEWVRLGCPDRKTFKVLASNQAHDA
jgi:predicted DNA-binding transcriptional regulator AlpA